MQRWLGQEVRNVAYYSSGATTMGGGEGAELADAFRVAWSVVAFNNLRDTEWQLYGVQLRRVDVAGLPSQEFGFTAGALAGGNAAESVATQVALLVHGVAYTAKPNRVRMYLAGLTEGYIVNGLWSTATLTSALVMVDDLHTISTASYSYDRVSARWNAANTLVDLWNEIEDYFAEDVPGTQRRRRIGRGQ